MKSKASRGMKWLYCLTLITVIFPSGMYGATSWAGLAAGGGLFSGGLLLLLVVPIIYRVILVARDPDRLAAYVSSARIKLLRNLAIFFMTIGLFVHSLSSLSTPSRWVSSANPVMAEWLSLSWVFSSTYFPVQACWDCLCLKLVGCLDLKHMSKRG